jgi:D-alanyl-D-alanine carboxypeptidase (penicillin-binding protein 5/6)
VSTIQYINKNFLMFLALSLLFVFTFFLSVSAKGDIRYLAKNQSSDVSLLPVLSDVNSLPILSAQGVIAKDVKSGVILYEKNPYKKLLPASTTKIMTAMVVLDYFDLDRVITVGEVSVEGQKMSLAEGEKITVKNLLYGLLVYSANDAAEVLAENYPGGRTGFIAAMNAKADEFSLESTHFVNPTGLDDDGHVSSAQDMVRLREIAMQDERFSKIVGTKNWIAKSADGSYVHQLTNINELLGKVDGVLGVKTGWTENARENLVSFIDRDGRQVLIALLGSQDRFGETEELIDWIFKSYDWKNAAYVDYSSS